MKGNTLPSQSYSSESCPFVVLSLFSKALFLRNGMLRESQLSTRNMVNAVTEEFWKMVNSSVYNQALQFKSECS